MIALIAKNPPELRHKLTAIARTERENVATIMESFKHLCDACVETNDGCPSSRTAEHVGTRESSAQRDALEVFESRKFPAQHIARVYIHGFKAGKFKRTGHLALTVRSLIANDCNTGPTIERLRRSWRECEAVRYRTLARVRCFFLFHSSRIFYFRLQAQARRFPSRSQLCDGFAEDTHIVRI